MTIDKEKKQRYNEGVSKLKIKADEVNRKIKYLESKKDENENINMIQIASLHVDLVSIHCAMTDLSLNLLGYKNESYLDVGRKSVYKALILFEGIVSSAVDIPLGENYELLSSIEGLSDKERLKLIRKIGFTISLLQDRYGENSKWRWSFVEIEGRYAVIAKNMFNFRVYQEKNDPNLEGFDERYDYLLLVKDLIIKSSNRYREKYELTNRSPEDMKKAIDFLRALKRIHILFKEHNEVQNISKRIELWSQKLEVDMKEKEKQLKKSTLATMDKKRKR
jgi:hypothetical protein